MGRAFTDLEAQAAAKRTKSGCTINPFSSSGPIFVYPYGTFYDADRVRSPSPSIEGHDIIVYIHTEGQERTIGSLEGIFACRKPIVLESGANIPCRREQMPEFAEKYEGRFTPFDDKK